MEPFSLLISIAVIFLLLLASGFFSGAEVAVFSSSELKIKNLARLDANAAIIDGFLSRKESIIIGILLCNNLVNLAIAALLTRSVGAIFLQFKLDMNLGLLLAVPVATVLILFFGEVLPKIIAFNFRETLVLRIARPLNFIITLLWPIIQGLSFLAKKLLFPFGVAANAQSQRFQIRKDKIFQYLNLGLEHGALDSKESEMLVSLCHFGDLVAKQIMTPRVSMTSIPVTLDLREILDIACRTGVSRFPVYREDLDDIIGILHIKDLLIHKRDIEKEGFNLIEMVRPCTFVPENKKVDALLRDFQKEKNHLAVVVDEYGGTAGLVTFVDILEEIIGEFEPAAEASQDIIETSPNCYVIDGQTSVDDLEETLNFTLPHGEYETIGGLIYDLLGRVPEVDEEITLENGLVFKVRLMEGNQIHKVFLDRNRETRSRGGAE